VVLLAALLEAPEQWAAQVALLAARPEAPAQSAAAGPPEVLLEHPVARPEVRLEVHQEAHRAVHLALVPVGHPEVRPEPLEVHLEAPREARPEVHLVVRPEARLAVPPEVPQACLVVCRAARLEVRREVPPEAPLAVHRVVLQVRVPPAAVCPPAAPEPEDPPVGPAPLLLEARSRCNWWPLPAPLSRPSSAASS